MTRSLTSKLMPLFAVCCFAQQSPSPDQEPITLRATTRLVVLDIVVTDKQGKPVRNLSKEDFTVLEDGEEQKISSFEPPGEHAPAPVGEDSHAAAGNNNARPTTLSSSALTILVLDELDTQIMDQAYARDEIKKFLRNHGPHLPEPTALMALEEKRLELLHDYTSDAQTLENALNQHRAELPFRLMTSEGVTGASERLGEALEAVREIAAANAHFAGRKNVIWIGPGFPSLDYMNAQPSDKAKLMGYVRETSDLMWQGRLAVYTVDPRGLEVVHENIGTDLSSGSFFAPPDPATADLVFEQLAPQTGGRIFRGLNDLDEQIATSIEDGGSFYALSYYPSDQDWNGKFRRIRVLMRNPDLKARTRAGYYGSLDLSPSFAELDRLLSRAVINPLSYHSLEVEAKARIAGQQPPVADIKVTLDPTGLHWESLPGDKHRCEITVVAAGFSTKGQVVSHRLKELEIVVDEKKYVHLMKNPMVLTIATEISPAAVRLRVVARDSTNGNMGTADLTPEGKQFH